MTAPAAKVWAAGTVLLRLPDGSRRQPTQAEVFQRIGHLERVAEDGTRKRSERAAAIREIFRLGAEDLGNRLSKEFQASAPCPGRDGVLGCAPGMSGRKCVWCSRELPKGGRS